ncbi:MAG: hypothetical protein M3Y27_23570 [Acidobacteriota bacterium]|nr:hypothetical protein [Acidobacteriota bacterium]
MRPANFQIESSTYLQQDGRDFDLHSDYDFVAFSYSVADRGVELTGRRSAGDWVRAEMPAGLMLSCRGVTHLSAAGRDPKMPFTEDDCLSDLSFAVPDGSFERSFAVSSAAEAFDPSWHWLFSFMSGFTLRVAGETAHLSAPEA